MFTHTHSGLLSILLKFLGSKFFIVVVALIVISIVSSIFILQLNNKDELISDLKEDIAELEIDNNLLEKRIEFQIEQLKLLDYYSNSNTKIEILPEIELNNKIKQAIELINKDYNNIFIDNNKRVYDD